MLVSKGKISRTDASHRVSRYEAIATLAPTLPSTFAAALSLAADRQFQIFDAIILAASAEAGCRLLLSEDMQDGFVWQCITVVNPFAATPHPMLANLLRS